jgi:hypothetical protein
MNLSVRVQKHVQLKFSIVQFFVHTQTNNWKIIEDKSIQLFEIHVETIIKRNTCRELKFAHDNKVCS